MATARVANIEEWYEAAAGASDNGTPARVGLRVVLDLDNDQRRLHVGLLRFADYAGLEAEFDAGSVTTVLDSSIDTYLAALSASEPLPAAAAGFIASEITY
jgi:hypothetical protein